MTETCRKGHRSGAARARWMCCASSALLLGAFLGSWRRGVLQKCKPLRRLLRGLCCASALIRSRFRRACCHWARDRGGWWFSFCRATEKPPGVAAAGRGRLCLNGCGVGCHAGNGGGGECDSCGRGAPTTRAVNSGNLPACGLQFGCEMG